MAAGIRRVGKKATGLILEVVVRFDTVRFVLTDDVRRVLLDQTLKLEAGRVGMGVEYAYYVGDVFV